MRALITGVTGQDGYYLSKLLNNKGYEVWGLSRQSFSLSGTHKVDLRDTDALRNCIREVQPDEVYHLGGMSSPIEGQGKPRECIETGASICTILSLCKDAKILNASSCSVFGVPYYTPQDEAHPIQPINSYGSMKAYTHFMTANEREHNNTFACNAILYHHESPHRSRNFFTQRLITSAIRISQGHLVPYIKYSRWGILFSSPHASSRCPMISDVSFLSIAISHNIADVYDIMRGDPIALILNTAFSILFSFSITSQLLVASSLIIYISHLCSPYQVLAIKNCNQFDYRIASVVLRTATMYG